MMKRRSVIALLALLVTGVLYAEPPLVEICTVSKEAGPGTREMSYVSRNATHKLHVAVAPIVTEADVVEARVDGEGRDVVRLVLSESGAEKFHRAIANKLGAQLAVLVKGVVVSTPVLQTTSIGGELQIAGNFTEAEAARLAQEIRSGMKN